MRVAIISRSWWGSVFGGSEYFVYRLASELHRMGYEVIGVTRHIQGYEEPRADHELVILRERRARSIISSFRFSRWAAKVVKKIRPDVVIVNSYWGEASPLFIPKDIPILALIHDVGLFKSEIAKRDRVRHILRTIVLRRVVKRVNVIVVPSQSVKDDLIKFLDVDPNRIHVLGFEGVDGPFRYEHVENEWFDIVQIGRFAPNKGQLLALEAFKLVVKDLDNAKLWLVGGRGVSQRDLEYLKMVMREADRINREIGKEVVRVLVDVPDVSEFYRLADVCIAPSLGEEGYGLTVLECYAYGKPVVASDVFVETGVASPDRSFIFKRGDHIDLAEKILYVYKHREEAMDKAMKGVEYAKGRSWTAVARAIDMLIQDVVGLNKSASIVDRSTVPKA